MRLVSIVVACALMSSAAQARAQSFLGASIGQSEIGEEATRELDLITSGAVDGKDTAWKIFGGYMFNRHFGFESAYVRFGDVSYSGVFSSLAVTGGKLEVSGFNVAAIGNLPVNEQFSVFGKIGLFFWEAEANDTTASIGAFSAAEEGSDASFGVGVGYEFTRNLGVRAEWELFKAAEADATLVSIGFLWRF
jgi:OmpA-OmpF porin, OOP family